MAPKRKGCDEYNVILDDAIGPVSWLRVTRTRDAKRNRQCFGINFHTGSPDDDSPITACLSGVTRTMLNIPEVDIRQSGLEERVYVRSRIIRTTTELKCM